MIKLPQTIINLSLAVSTGLTLAGSIFKQPALIATGLGVVGAGSVVVVLNKQNQEALDKHEQLHKYLSELQIENTALKSQFGELSEGHRRAQKNQDSLQLAIASAQTKLEKLEKRVKTHHSSQRLQVAAIQKLQHSVKVNSSALAVCETQITKLRENQKTVQNQSLPSASPSPQQSVTITSQTTESVTRIYVDGNNLKFAIDKLNIVLDYLALQVELGQDASSLVFKYYTGCHFSLTREKQRFFNYLNHLGYQIVRLPLLHREDGSWKTVGDDIQIATDMMKEVKSGDAVILITGDGDFVPVVREVQSRGAKVTVVAHPTMIYHQLRNCADDFISLDAIKYKVAKQTKLNVA